jgi:ubiquinone biosynthesis protein Coq4
MSQYARVQKSGRRLDALRKLPAAVAALRSPSQLAPELRDFGLRSPWSALMTLKNFAVTTWDPAKSDIRQGINALIEGALRDPKPEAIEEARKRSPVCAALWDERYDPPLDLDQLATLPAGTLGAEYARFVRENGIEPLGSQVEWGEPKNLLQYNMLRAYKLHDVMHVVLGCPATPLGEVPIVAYSVGQAGPDSKAVKAPALALAVVLLHIALRRTNEFAEACRLSGEWTRIGERGRPYTEFRFEEMMDQRVENVRERVLAAA